MNFTWNKIKLINKKKKIYIYIYINKKSKNLFLAYFISAEATCLIFV